MLSPPPPLAARTSRRRETHTNGGKKRGTISSLRAPSTTLKKFQSETVQLSSPRAFNVPHAAPSLHLSVRDLSLLGERNKSFGRRELRVSIAHAR